MKAKKHLTVLTSILLGGILIYSCGPSKTEIFKIDPAYGEYISAYTSGMVTRKSTIRIELNQSLFENLTASNSTSTSTTESTTGVSDQNHALPDAKILEDIFTFEPAVKGKAVWINNRVIEFIPEENFPANQFYNVDFDLERVAKVKNNYENFHFQFATFQQNLFVETGRLSIEDDYNVEWQKLEGTVTTSDFEDMSQIRRTLHAELNGKSLPVKISETYYDNSYNFVVNSIERKSKKGELIVSWDGTKINSSSKGRKVIEIPALGDFRVSAAKVTDSDDQKVELTFSEPILYNQNLKGIISIEGIDDLTFGISQNTVNVYLPNRFIGTKKITVSNGIKNVKGHNMLTAYSGELLFLEPKPLVRIKGNGSILPNSNGLIFPFEAISLKAVDVRIIKIYENNIHHFLQINDLNGEDGLTRFGKIIKEKTIKLDYDKSTDLKQWNKHVIDLGSLIKPDPGAIYRVSIKFRKEYSICSCGDNPESEGTESDPENPASSESNEEDDDKNWNEDNWHGYGFDGGYDTWEYYSEDYSPCDNYYYEGKAVSRNILASDLGMIFKLDENKLSHAFISNMLTTDPVRNAEVQYFDFTKQLIASGTTDENGMMDVKLKEKPFLMIAKSGKQRGYLKLSDGYVNSLSKFDVEGEHIQKGVKGFIYGERGVWRPGDSLYLSFILEDKDHSLPQNHPVKFELTDPNGQLVYETTKTKNVNGTYDFRTQTGTEAITGNYTATTHVGNRIYTKNIKIETVKPNRLKIYLDFDKLKFSDTVSHLSAKWLHGATAKNLLASVNVTLNQTNTTFPKYKNYSFDSPIRNYYSDEETIFNGKLDEKGEARIKTNINVAYAAPGMLRATYITKVFEEGGDYSIDRCSRIYSPFKTYVGLETPETDKSSSLQTGKNYKFDVVTLSENGNPVKTDRLQVKIYKIEWRWWYEKDKEDFADYIARSGTVVVKDTLIKANNGKTHFNFQVNYPDYGRYIVTVTDLEGRHQTGKIISIDWPYWNRANRSTSENANMLNFSCDKEKYTTGESIKLSFPAPSNGRALVSVETRSKVIKKFWINTNQGETIHQFQATKDMAPNAYIHVTLIQPHSSTKNDLPIRMYGIVPVLVDDPNTHLNPQIDMPDVLRPESRTSITVKEEKGRKMTYTLAMVDDGLLDLTRFETPQPWDVFYAREALGVQTWDMYDYVIGAYAGKLDKLLSIGGDGDLLAGKGAKANRFKPMVKYLGPFTLEAGQSKTHQVEIPNYVGSVRVMVVAQNEGAYGNAQKTVAVKKPLMILPSLPRVLGPGEEVYLPVNVFAMEKYVKDVSITVEVNDILTILGDKQQKLTFADIGDEVINFKLKVSDKIGLAKVKITATGGGEKAVEEIELDVRASNPKVVDGTQTVIEAGKEWSTQLNFKGISGSNKATVEISSVPSIDLEKRLDYLIQYPHGCIEQTTSGAFPQLYVSNLLELDDKQKQRISKNVKAAIKRIQLFQTSNGGFSYWPGEVDESDWGSNYAGHFILEAEKQGYSLPGNLKSRWVKFQQQQAKSWNTDLANNSNTRQRESNEVIQAYRLFVLALSNNAELGAMNRLREERNLSVSAKWRLAAAYQLVGQHEVAQKLISKLPVTVQAYTELSGSYGSDERDEAMILETLSLMKNDSKASTLAGEVAKNLSTDQWMSTQETAYSLLAICEFAGVNGTEKKTSFSYSINAENLQDRTGSKGIYQLKFTEKDFLKKAGLKLKNTGKSKLFVKVSIEGVPLVGDKSSSSKDLKLSLKFKDLNGNEISVDKLKQGTEFIAEVTIKNPGKRGYYKEMALNQIFPGGWEIHNSRMDETSERATARYQDIRDDRVYTYYDLGENESKTFSIQLNACYLGRFYLPTTYSEAMYDRLINARTPGKWVEVIKG